MKFRSFVPGRFLAAALGWMMLTLVSHAQTVLPNARVGQNYTFQVTTNPPAAAGTVYSATGLPAGIGINAASGQISGTPTAAGVRHSEQTVRRHRWQSTKLCRSGCR